MVVAMNGILAFECLCFMVFRFLLGVVCLYEEAGGPLELLGGLLFVYGDFSDRGEAPFFCVPRLW